MRTERPQVPSTLSSAAFDAISNGPTFRSRTPHSATFQLPPLLSCRMGTMLSRALATALLASFAIAQDKPIVLPPSQPPIKVSVNEVIVPVTVTDDKGRFVSNLDKTDFRIMDEGQEQSIEYFSRERSQPVVI